MFDLKRTTDKLCLLLLTFTHMSYLNHVDVNLFVKCFPLELSDLELEKACILTCIDRCSPYSLTSQVKNTSECCSQAQC